MLEHPRNGPILAGIDNGPVLSIDKIVKGNPVLPPVTEREDFLDDEVHMKRILMTGVAAAALTSMASAADLGAQNYAKAPAPVAPIYNWTGFYFGAHVSGAWNANNNLDVSDPLGGGLGGLIGSRGNSGSFLGGGQVGADYQFSPNFLIGIESQISGLANNERTFFVGGNGNELFQERSDWLASVTGRLGYVSGPGLFYVKGGVAFRNDNGVSPSDTIRQIQAGGGSFAVDRKQTGYTVGGGLEYMFAPAWSAKAEYQYYNFGATAVSIGAPGVSLGIKYRDEIQAIKAGVNYHFNWGAVAAGY